MRQIVPYGYAHAKHSMTLTKDKNVVARTQSHVIYSINLTLSRKINVISGSLMYATHNLMVMNPFAKYGMPMSNPIKRYGP